METFRNTKIAFFLAFRRNTDSGKNLFAISEGNKKVTFSKSFKLLNIK